MAKFSIYKQVRTDKGWRYCKAAFHPNGKIKPNVVVVSGVEEKHTEGRYFLNFNNEWIDVGLDALKPKASASCGSIRWNTRGSLAGVWLARPSDNLARSRSVDGKSSGTK